MHKNAVILIPAYKPSLPLIDTVRSLVGYNFQIVVVDDGSGEDYKDCFLLLKDDAIVLTKEKNEGKGLALKTGFSYIYENLKHTSCVITVDADGQHKLSDILNLYTFSVEKNCEFVIGCRTFQGYVPFRSKFGNTLTRFVFSKASGVQLHDTQSGLRFFQVHLLPELMQINGNRYEYETNVLLWASKSGISITEFPITTVYEENNPSSHFRAVIDSIRIYSKIIMFSASSILSFFVDFILLFLFGRLLGTGESQLILSIIMARIFSSAINFTLNRSLVFKSKNNLLRHLLKYYSLAATLLLFNCLLMYLFNLVLLIPLGAAKIVTETLLFVFSYFIQRTLVFSSTKLSFLRKEKA